MKNCVIVLWSLLLVVALAGCGKSQEVDPNYIQHWEGVDVRIETHPDPPLHGMCEIVVIITGLHGKPISDYLVYIRGGDAAPWVETIQDGFIGVYRRAVDLGVDDKVMLQVKLEQNGQQKTVLYFPLKLAAE